MQLLVITIVALVATTALAEAAGHGRQKARPSQRTVETFRQADIDRLPISVTRPDNARHYKFQSLPLWAARALEPRQTR